MGTTGLTAGRRAWTLAFAACVAASCASVGRGGAEPELQYNRDIRPILSAHCFACHGPDAAKRKANLRLDNAASGTADLGGRHAIVPGDPGASELYVRVSHEDESDRMPPAKFGRRLTADQVATLKRWIEQGAKWQPHWSLLTPKRPPAPTVTQVEWPRNSIDRFILARLDSEGLSPALEADRETLIRRVSLDLTGLPPTPEEVDAFLTDDSAGAFERVVDRLLASPRFGERMAARWLDAARYADTNGYQSDGERFMWRWRDWVIQAFNANTPFDRFTIEQLAGDLLPNPTLDQRIATGFNRNHRGNAEGGIIPEEYAAEYVADRVETTATVWMGLTIGCARCHDHKFDPISQRDFYKLFAYFNNVPEKGRAVKFGNSPPLIKAPTPDQQAQLSALEQELSAVERRLDELEPAIASSQEAWARRIRGEDLDWTIQENLIAQLPFDADSSEPGRRAFRAEGGAFASGRMGGAAEFDGVRIFDAGDIAPFGFDDRFTLAGWVRPSGAHGGTIISRMTDSAEGDGYAIVLARGKLQVNLVKRWLDDALRVETELALDPDRWSHVAVTYDGSRLAAGVKVYLDGRPAKTRVLLDELNQSFKTSQPLRIGGGNGPDGRFVGRIDDVRIYGAVLEPCAVAAVATSQTVSAIAGIEPARRSEGQAWKLRACFLAEYAPEAVRKATRAAIELRQRREALVESFPTTMVMKEVAVPRPTFLLLQGQYDRPGERIRAGVPDCLPPILPEAEANRLAFARWLTNASHPLTARVAVNRYWQMLFGNGLVKTVDDFGVQGEWPSHPELLDWLAAEFVDSGWDVKATLRRIVCSATYRQSSRATPSLRLRDPENRLLARGPRLRLPAEMIRDQALAAGGLLAERLGGPSVKPYQPEGLWRDLAEVKEYLQGHGADLYRRGLYTFWKRTVAPPSMVAFDAATRETCTVRESRTNTPLQALTLLNDVTYVEAARALAARAMREGGPEPQRRIARAFRIVTAREPNATEISVLCDGYRAHLAHFRANPGAAVAMTTAGESRGEPSHDVSELAATSVIAGVILNLDEAITKE
jgi:hypothetical protein